MVTFHNGGVDLENAGKEKGNEQKKQSAVYSYEHDAEYIYSAFLTQYGIDLNEIKYLHWWKFRAMFKSLNEDHLFSKILSYRSAKTNNKMASEEKQHIEKMKKLYALPLHKNEKDKTDLIANILMGDGDLSKIT